MKKYLIYLLLILFIASCNDNKKTATEQRIGGVVEDNPVWVDNVPVISSESADQAKRGGVPKVNTRRDRDSDGVPDYIDNCPTVYGTLKNGCPDTTVVNPPPPIDSDGDGINDNVDGCPTQPETLNGFQDNDGCPDSVTPPPPPPTSTEVSLIMPPVGNQAGEGSCVPYAIGYAARSAEQYYRTGATSYSNSINVFSPEFIYNLTRFTPTNCQSGTSMQMVLDTIKKLGICTFEKMPYDGTNGCDVEPSSAQYLEAANYKITGYSKIHHTDRAAIKSMINTKHPVIVTMLADNSFINAKGVFTWKVFSGAGMLPHCFAICGYDDSKNAYKIINSWGTSWGDAGYGWIDYNFFEIPYASGGKIAGGGYCYVIN